MQTEFRRPLPFEVASMVKTDLSHPDVVKIDPQELRLKMDQARRDISRGQVPESSCVGCFMAVIDPLGIIIERRTKIQFDQYQKATIANLNAAVEIVNGELPKKAEEKRALVDVFRIQGDSKKILDANGWYILDDEIVNLSEDNKAVFVSGSTTENHHNYDVRTDMFISNTGEVFLASLTSPHSRSSYREVNYTSSLQRRLRSNLSVERDLFKAKLVEACQKPGERVRFTNTTRQETHLLVVSKFSNEDPSHLELVSQIIESAKRKSFESAYEDGCVRQKREALQKTIGISPTSK